MAEPPLRILFAAPAYWPATAFGGPIWMARELNGGATGRGHMVDVVTTSLVDIGHGRTTRARSDVVDGATVHYLATPLRYRWMGITPGLSLTLRRLPRPDVAHLFGFRDPVTTGVAAWCRLRGIPYVFEPLGMMLPKLRKIALKRAFDGSVARGVASAARAIVVTSRFERDEVIAAGAPVDRIVIRGNGFPDPSEMAHQPGALRARLGVAAEAPLALYVGRMAVGKGIDHLLAAARAIPSLHVALVGPDDGHGVLAEIEAAQASPSTRGRVHRLVPDAGERPLGLYGDADVFVLASEGESFGMVAAEAAAAGVPVVVSDRCGVADVLDDGALVVPCSADAVRAAIERVLSDPQLAGRLAARGLVASERNSWARIVEKQEQVYLEALARR